MSATNYHRKCLHCVRRVKADCYGVEMWDWINQGRPPMDCYVNDIKDYKPMFCKTGEDGEGRD